ncbi:MAG: WYL domain-containing protein, partial [Caldilinea sp.]
LGAHAVGRLATDAERSLDKLAIALPKPLRAEMERLSEIIRFIAPGLHFDLDEPRLATLQQAIREQRVVWIRYHALESNEVTERAIEPHELSFFSGAWYVSAYCRLRQASRSFRLNRIDELKLLRTHFDRRMPAESVRQPLTVRIRFATEVARWVRERQHYGFQCEEAAGVGADDGVVMTYLVDSLSEFKPWLLAWGAAAEPLEPPQLRAEIRRELETWQKILT